MRLRTWYVLTARWYLLVIAVLLALLSTRCNGCPGGSDRNGIADSESKSGGGTLCGGVDDDTDPSGYDGNESESESEGEDIEHTEYFPLGPFNEVYVMNQGNLVVGFASSPALDSVSDNCGVDPNLQALVGVLIAQDDPLADAPTIYVYVGRIELSDGCSDNDISRGLSIAAYEAAAWDDCYCGKTPTLNMAPPQPQPQVVPAFQYSTPTREHALPEICTGGGAGHCPLPRTTF